MRLAFYNPPLFLDTFTLLYLSPPSLLLLPFSSSQCKSFITRPGLGPAQDNWDQPALPCPAPSKLSTQQAQLARVQSDLQARHGWTCHMQHTQLSTADCCCPSICRPTFTTFCPFMREKGAPGFWLAQVTTSQPHDGGKRPISLLPYIKL